MASRLAGKIIAAAAITAGVAVVAVRLRPRPSPAIGTAQWQPLAPNPAAHETASTDAANTAQTSDPEADNPISNCLASSDGTCPSSHPVKGNTDSGIFHIPGGLSYERTKAERCYTDAAAALADGLRQAKR